MADCRPQRAQCDEEAGAAVLAMRPVPAPLEVLLRVIVEAPACFSDCSHRPDGEGVGAELLEGVGALLPYLPKTSNCIGL